MGGITPVTGFHWVIERPDSVSRVAPPTRTMRKTRPATAISQKRTAARTSKLVVRAAAGALRVRAIRNGTSALLELEPRLLTQTRRRRNATETRRDCGRSKIR